MGPRQFHVSFSVIAVFVVVVLFFFFFFWPHEDVSGPVSTENATSFSQSLLRRPTALSTRVLVSISAQCGGQ